MDEKEEKYAEWSVLELMGHRRLGGFVREVSVAGAGMLRIDIPGDGDDKYATQFYPPSALYCLTPTTEAMARAVAKNNRPEPVTRWELPPAPPPNEGDPETDDSRDADEPY